MSMFNSMFGFTTFRKWKTYVLCSLLLNSQFLCNETANFNTHNTVPYLHMLVLLNFPSLNIWFSKFFYFISFSCMRLHGIYPLLVVLHPFYSHKLFLFLVFILHWDCSQLSLSLFISFINNIYLLACRCSVPESTICVVLLFLAFAPSPPLF